ncbi:hypothetical protein BSL78_00664 [Apostichopus japonicus]|uniref:Uncharacterized protein n=1 Tax=Stichopus japonicus TaxID=307972 RepID=A0A2G8LQ03_STIJA|nr:hypothetical protein BSL78_00664 [Apostichopus japonicus]
MDRQQPFFEDATTSVSQSEISLVPSDTTSHLITSSTVTNNECYQPPQCSSPISLMYEFLAHHNLPCKYKATFEHNAQACLLTIGEGDHDAWSGSHGKVSSHVTRDQRRKKKHDKRHVVVRDAEVAQKLTGSHVSEVDEIQNFMTSEEVFSRFIHLLSPRLVSEGLGQWITCPHLHYLSVNDSIPDSGFYKTKSFHNRRSTGLHYHGDNSSWNTRTAGRQTTSASGRLGVKHASSTVLRAGGIKEGQGSRPTSSEVTDKDMWQELEMELQPVYSFKHFNHSQQYAEQYREIYTYSHLREKSMNALAAAKLQKTCAPRAGLVCYKSANRKAKGMTGSKLLNNGRSQGSIVEREEPSTIKWKMNPRLKESCDPHLSVNNPSPTELTTLGKMPIIRRSSPSIPSNTNGKYGGRGSNRLYPFQLQISTETRTVSSPYKRLPRSILDQR